MRKHLSWIAAVIACTIGVGAAASGAAAAELPAPYRAFVAQEGGSRFVQVDGVRLHYLEAGPRHAPTLLLLHGSPDNVYAWRDVMPALTEHYHVIAPDLLGFGQSGAPDGPLTWAAEIASLGGFIRELHLHHVTLVMTDIGSLFGASWASAHPRQVDGIALWETVTAPIPSFEVLGDYCQACVGFFQGPKDPTLREQYIVQNPAFAEQVYGGQGLLHPLSGEELAGYGAFLATPEQRARVADIGAQMPIGGVPASTARIAAGFARYLRTSDVPKLVLYATPGSILPAASANVLGFPNMTVAKVGPGIHYLAEDAPQAVAQQVLRWRDGLALTGYRARQRAAHR